MEFSRQVNVHLPKCGGADGEGRGKVSSYQEVVGQIAGLFKVVRDWHAVGHPHKDPVISHDVIKTGHSFSCSIDLISHLHLVSHRVNELIKAVDPAHYEALVKLRAVAEKKHKFLQVIGSDDPLLMEGREIMMGSIGGTGTFYRWRASHSVLEAVYAVYER
ncbi:hypothetical protein B0H10DRAFT_2249345 [Mycena sp. CBHHK59/15]|nr:hypothetical protein B0H10DRAFT_2249345 [Mycena sp. CBHHK59/15]